MSMAMLLNAATAAEARRKLLDPGRGRIPIHSLLCPPDPGSSHASSPDCRALPARRTGSVLGKRKLHSGGVSDGGCAGLRRRPATGHLSRHSSQETSAGSCSESGSDPYTDSDSSPSPSSSLAFPSRSPARRRRSPSGSPVQHGGHSSWRGSGSSEGERGGAGGMARNAPRRRWKEDEDELLLLVVRQHGPGRWNRLAEQFPGRNGRQVRLRWMNHLQPSLDKREWRKEEDEVLLEAHATLGNKWALIAMKLNGRTDNSVKNRYKSLMRKQQREIRARAPSR